METRKNRKIIKKIRCPITFCLVVFFSIITSCDNEWPDDQCPCQPGGTIGGWEDPDTTDIEKKDTVGSLEVIVDTWEHPSTKDIQL